MSGKRKSRGGCERRRSVPDQLPDRKLLQAKLHAFCLANVGEGDEE